MAAQAPSSSITGIVSDTAGAAIAGVEVTAIHVETGFEYRTHTVATGQYWLGGLRPGRYEVAVRVIGYAKGEARTDVAVGETATLRFVLRLAPVRLEGIVVVAERPLVETTQSDIAFVLDRESIARLPEESRRFIDLALLAPGATAAAPSVDPVAPVQLGGLNSSSVAVLVDGANLIGGFTGEYAGNFPLLAIQEFEVLTSSYAAEFGQAASGVVNAVTRSGTNEFRAEAFLRYRHRQLNALGAFEKAKPDFSQHHWGVAVGGPIRRDRTHFFTALERRVENAFSTVETGGVFPAAEGTVATPSEATLLFARVDHRLSPSHEVMLRYGAQLSNARTDVGESSTCEFAGSQSVGGAENGADATADMHSILGRHRWMITERIRNELTASFVRASWSRTRLAGEPQLQYPTMCQGGSGFQWDRVGTRFVVDEKLAFTVAGGSGTHRVKAGAQIGIVTTDNLSQDFRNGNFVFLADTAATPFLFIQRRADWRSDATNGQFGVFVQDDWSPVPDLTLNLGLRYDIETNGIHRGFVSPDTATLRFVRREPRSIDKNNLAPRIGLAWDVAGEGRTVVRAGFGVFHDQLTTIQGDLEGDPSLWVFLPNPGPTVPPDAILDAAAAPLLHVLDSVVRTPVTRQYSLGIERVFPADVVVRVDGILTQARNVPFWRERNPFVGPGRKYPGYGPILEELYRGRAETQMLTMRARKRFPWGRVDVHYTLADRRVTSDNWGEVLPVSDTASDFSSELGPADWDERHRIVVLANAILPLGLEGALKVIYSSARPFTRISASDSNGDGFFNDRPDGVEPNSERGPDFSRVDIGVGRHFVVGGFELGVIFNVYNLLNRTNLKSHSVVENVSSAQFGQSLFAWPKRQAEVGVGLHF